MEGLKPCPFCGEKGAHQKDCYLNLYFESEVLDANIPWEVMVAAWNKRHERTCKLQDDDSEPASLVCSSCRATCAITWITGEWNYCPNCGAKVVS